MDEKKLTDEVVAENAITDEEIVKALEFKAKFDAKVAYVDGCACKHIRVADILDLIHRLQSKEAIQHYTSEIEGLELELSQSLKVIEMQKAEIERLAKVNMDTIGKNAELLYKNDELQKRVDELEKWCETTYKEAVEREEDAYSLGFDNGEEYSVKETAKKFAERVKMAFYYHFDELIPSIMADKIDEICKEITEGKDNESGIGKT